jgi:pilus assembly protein CpaC
VRTRTGIAIVCFCSWFFSGSAKQILNAETPLAPRRVVGAVSAQDASDELIVAVGKSVLVDLARPIQRISLGSDQIADATAMTPTEVLINGKTPGETSLIVWEAGGGRHFFNVKVLASNSVANDQIEAIRRELRMELPGQEVKVSADNGNIFHQF